MQLGCNLPITRWFTLPPKLQLKLLKLFFFVHLTWPRYWGWNENWWNISHVLDYIRKIWMTMKRVVDGNNETSQHLVCLIQRSKRRNTCIFVMLLSTRLCWHTIIHFPVKNTQFMYYFVQWFPIYWKLWHIACQRQMSANQDSEKRPLISNNNNSN